MITSFIFQGLIQGLILASIVFVAVSIGYYMMTQGRNLLKQFAQMYTIQTNLYAQNEIASSFSHNPDYDSTLDGVDDSIKTLLKNIDGVTVIKSDISQVPKLDFMPGEKDRRQATINHTIIISDPRNVDVGMLIKSIEQGVKNDDRHDGLQRIDVQHNQVPTKDLRDENKDYFKETAYTTMHNDRTNKEQSSTDLETELEKVKQKQDKYTENNPNEVELLE